jgi:nitrate reductase gamma subunit
MEQILNFAKGPLFAGCFVIMLLGLMRIILITIWEGRAAVARAGDKNIPYKSLIKETLGWLLPFKHILNSRGTFSVISFVFHIGLILVPIFLLDHILLWRRLGISWPSMPPVLADILTLSTIAAGFVLFINRVFHRNTRFLSSAIDYILLLLLLVIFINGFVASRAFNPIPYNTVMLMHVLSADLILLLLPFSKLAHCVLYPFLRIASSIAWHFPAHAGEKINLSLYGEEVKKV